MSKENNAEIAKLVKKFRANIDSAFTSEEKKDFEPFLLVSIMKNIFEFEQNAEEEPHAAALSKSELFTSYIWLLSYYKLDLNIIKFDFTKEELDNFSWYWLLERFGKNLKKNQLNMVFNKKEFRDEFNNQKLYYKEQFFEYLNLYLAKRGVFVKKEVINCLNTAIRKPPHSFGL